MTYRQLWFTIVFVSIVTMGGHAFGDRFRVGFFVVFGVLGLLGTLAYTRRKARFADALAARSEVEQERVMLALENAALRPEIAERLERPLPRLPLRGERELFRYPPSVGRTARWMMRACLLLAGFFAVGWATDAMRGTEVFVGHDMPPWESVALIAGFAGGALIMHWCAAAGEVVLEVTEASLTLHIPGRAARSIPWPAVTEARVSELSRTLSVRSRTQRIAIADTLIGYGRIVNLVATRLPAGARWVSG